MDRNARLKDALSRSGTVLLLLLGCISLVLYRVGVRAEGVRDIRWFIKLALVQSAIYLLASVIVVRARSSRATLLIAIAFAVLFRLSILFAPPYLSDDIYRYIWDGRVQAAGINPFRYIPSAPELTHLRDEAIYQRINRRDFAPTIYPPVAQIIFFLTTRISESATWMKATMVGFEALAVWAIAQLLASLGLPRQRLLMYAWHPLVIWEFAGSGHCDAIAIAFVALAFLTWQRKAKVATGFALACATMVKLFPAVLLPAFVKEGRWRVMFMFVVVVVVGYLAYLSVGPAAVFGYLPGYAQEQKLITGEQFYLLAVARKLFGSALPALVYVIAVILIMAAIAGWAILRKTRIEDALTSGLLLATATTVFFAPHYSWYFTWLVPFLCFRLWAAVFYLTIASFLLYGTWLGDSADDMFVLNSLIYLPAFLIGIIEFTWRRVRLRRL